MSEDITDPQQVEDAKKKDQLELHQLKKDIRKITKDKAGIRFIAWILDEGRVFSTGMTGDNYTFFNEGRRTLALKIFAEVLSSVPERMGQILKTEVK